MDLKQIDGGRFELPNTEIWNERINNPYNYVKEICDQFEHDFYSPYIKGKDLVVLDIGANAGLFAAHVEPIAKAIYCVEPTPEHNKARGELNLPLINIDMALNDYTGTCTFNWCGINTTMNSLQERGDRKFEVKCITLKDLFDKLHLDEVDLMKVDIEGSEHAAITKETLAPVADKIKQIWFEYHPVDEPTQQKFIKIFEEAGFKVQPCHNDSLYCYK